MKLARILWLSCCVSLLSSCFLHSIGDFADEEKSPYAKVPAAKLYQDATVALQKQDYPAAVAQYEALETQYPFSQYTEKTQLNLIYAYHKSGDEASAAAQAARFIHLYPKHPHVDYAYYMKGLANVEMVYAGLMGHYLPVDKGLRDVKNLHEAYDDFAVFVRRFPTSPYAANAKQHMIDLRNTFARRELAIAKFYYQRHAYEAALNRAAYIIEQYQQAPQVSAALALMAKCNAKLGLKQAVKEVQQVVQANPSLSPPKKAS